MREIHEVMGNDPGLTLGAILGTLGIIAGMSIAITGIVAAQWRAVRQTEDANALKQDMLDRGMSADEIATVMEASSKSMWARHVFGGNRSRSCGSKWHAETRDETHAVA